MEQIDRAIAKRKGVQISERIDRDRYSNFMYIHLRIKEKVSQKQSSKYKSHLFKGGTRVGLLNHNQFDSEVDV